MNSETRQPQLKAPSFLSTFNSHAPTMHRSLLIALALGSSILASPTVGAATSTTSLPTGTIEGRVLNPVSGDYLSHAAVRIQGTDISAFTVEDGRFRLTNVPAGNAMVTVNYTGYLPASASVTVTVGQITRRDFDLESSLKSDSGQRMVALERFTVSSTREGTAKAIMEQRSALTVKNVVATDTFGAIVEGNVGDVLQYVPGMQIIYSGDVPSTVSMAGMDSKYGALMVDGVRTSSATREPSLFNYSAYATDTIEVNKTNSAEMDADAPAGSINMRSKSAFQRKGRFFSWETYVIHNSYHPFTLGKMNGPNDGQSRPLNPSVVLDYSDVYLDGKLGVVLNLSETNSTSGSGFLNFTYNNVPTAASPASIVLTALNYGKGAIIQKRRGGGLNVEYKMSPAITLALRGQASWQDARNYNTQFMLNATRPTLGAGSSATVFIAPPTANNTNRFNMAGGITHRIRNSHSFSPAFYYDGKKLRLEASFAYTRQGEYRRNLRSGDDRDDEVGSANLQLFGVGWTATRPDLGSTDFEFTQTAGPDLFVLNNWRATSLTNNIARAPNEPITKNLLAQINAKHRTDWSRPTFFKMGLKSTAGRYANTMGNYTWTYVGPTGDRLQADLPLTIAPFDPHTGGNLFTGRPIPFIDRHALGVIQREHPEYFIPDPTNPTRAANVTPNRSAREYLDAAYVMGNTQFGRLTLQAGVRYERTESQGTSYERGVPKTRVGNYDDTFLSGSARYRFTENFMAIASFSQSIQRADLNSMSGVLTVNDTNRTGTLPNPELKPEHGNNYSIRVEQYFEPVGTFSVGVFQFDITDLQKNTPGIPAEEIGLDDDFPGYTFTALSNVGDFTNKGIEFAYSQQLTFLPGVFKGLGVFANYNQFDRSDPELAYGAAPKTASGGISFRYRRFNIALRGAWKNDAFVNANNYTTPTFFFGASLDYRLTERISIAITGRNITNQARISYRRAEPDTLNAFEIQGASWVFGLKGVF